MFARNFAGLISVRLQLVKVITAFQALINYA